MVAKDMLVKCKICGIEEVRSMRRSDARCFPCRKLQMKEYYEKHKKNEK
jgi:hypothetical protein